MNTYLDTALSLVLIILVFSVVTYIIQELIAVNLQLRGKMLYSAIEKLMDAKAFFAHAEIASLKKKKLRLPSYIPAANFALAVMDLVVSAPGSEKTNNYFEDVRAGLSVYKDSNGNLSAVLKNLVDTSSDIRELQHKLEQWYNSYMDRVSGWYQANTVKTIRVIAIGVTIFFNLNMITMTREIVNNSAIRSNMAAMAEGIAAHPDLLPGVRKSADSLPANYTADQIAAIKKITSELSATSLPLGWKDHPIDFGIFTILGWLITAGCLSMGAPFWFNLLVQLVNLRRAGIKPK
jgi:hypothetical protein